jgi:hypothetical protein
MNRMRIAAALTLCALAASTQLRADVRTEEKTLVKFEGVLGKVVGLFGGRAAREGVKSTVAVKGSRKATMNDTTGQIVDLTEEKIYDLDIKKKTYKVTTFAELRRQMEEAMKKAQDNARAQEPAAAPERDPNQKEVEFDFNVKETGEKKTINGFETRQFLVTLAMHEKGKTLEESGGMMLTTDTWLTPSIPAMKEIFEFDMRYAKALAGPMLSGASPQEMASALAMYPGLKEGLARMGSETSKMQGTPVMSIMTVDAVKSAEQLAEEQKAASSSSGSSSSSPATVGGLLGGLARRRAAANNNAAAAGPKPQATFMTTTSEILSVATSVSDTDVAIPAGFKENR